MLCGDLQNLQNRVNRHVCHSDHKLVLRTVFLMSFDVDGTRYRSSDGASFECVALACTMRRTRAGGLHHISCAKTPMFQSVTVVVVCGSILALCHFVVT